ncbi:MAG TPA: GTP cyclohydrolase I FolE [Ktedonobacterales bacterium]|nr:GTP cyclohydrolase I FolE [Ktedonobacterales bacterium]
MSKEGSRRSSKKSVPADQWSVMSAAESLEAVSATDETALSNGHAQDRAVATIEGEPAVDEEAIKTAVVMMLKAIGEDPTREGLRDTPRRIAEMYRELFAGLQHDPAEVLQVSFDEGHSEMVIVKDIPFYTVCEHHFLPFHGVAHVGYIPRGRVVGISKLARAVEILARRPQLQERLTSQIADTVMTTLEPNGVGVVLEGSHLCMQMRGVKKPGSKVVTSAMRGVFKNVATRAEFMALIRDHVS